LASTSPESTMQDNPRVTTSLLKIVIAMAMEQYAYDPRMKKSDVPSKIVEDAEYWGISIDADTVRKWLKAGADLIDQEHLERLDD
jgi:hypothetical protein